MSTLLFYRDQAAREHSAADAATLENVRERSRGAAAASSVLVERSAQSDAARAARSASHAPDALVDETSENFDRGCATVASAAVVPS